MPEANISPPTDDETTARAARKSTGAAVAAGSRSGKNSVGTPAPAGETGERATAGGPAGPSGSGTGSTRANKAEKTGDLGDLGATTPEGGDRERSGVLDETAGTAPARDGAAGEDGAPEHHGAAPEDPAPEGRAPEDFAPEDEDFADDVRTGLTPRQARRVRAVVSAVVMVAVAVALAVRLHSAPSVLTVGFYGIALILSGVAIGLSRRGRTRVATGVLVLGFAAVGLAEWLLASAE